MINKIEEEKNKYIKAWQTGVENNSRTVLFMPNYIESIIQKNWKILDIGTGNGFLVCSLRNKNYNIYGVDHTLEGLNFKYPLNKFNNHKLPDKLDINKEWFYESSLLKLPFNDNEFDFTCSVDVLEHLPPEHIETAIKEIYRITKYSTFHCIATFADNRGGFTFHLTVQPIDWWKIQFKNLNSKSIITQIIDRKEFLNKYQEKK